MVRKMKELLNDFHVSFEDIVILYANTTINREERIAEFSEEASVSVVFGSHLDRYTGMKPLSVRYKDKESVETKWRGVYFQFVKWLYNDYKEYLAKNWLRLNALEEENGWRSPKVIADGYYVALHGSATALLGNLRKMMQDCHISENDVNIVCVPKDALRNTGYSVFEANSDGLGEDAEEEENRIEENSESIIEVDDDGDPNEDIREAGGENVIYHGVPGCGKSHSIGLEYPGTKDFRYTQRIVFHEEYTNSDFIGQVMPQPTADGNSVKYVFVPGPFTRILKKAYWNPSKPYYLIIEEINRGKAASIFGEVFQLLDRFDDENEAVIDGKHVMLGTSKYPINNANIAKEVYGDEEHPIRIPANLFILATMNTSDQNVFVLDTAFQRRWRQRLVMNSFEKHPFANKKILDTSVTWKQFCNVINAEILNKGRGITGEDKQLGSFFISRTVCQWEDGTMEENDDKKEFIEIENKKRLREFTGKILKYLWDDAFKSCRREVFNRDHCKSLEDIVRLFTGKEKDERWSIFQQEIINELHGNK